MNNEKKNYNLTPKEGERLCAEARASIEYGMTQFPEIDDANAKHEASRFHRWVLSRNSKDTEEKHDE